MSPMKKLAPKTKGKKSAKAPASRAKSSAKAADRARDNGSMKATAAAGRALPGKVVSMSSPALSLRPPTQRTMSDLPLPTEAKALQEGRYVYGIIEADPDKPVSLGKTGIGGSNETVYTVHHAGVAAVVSKTSVFIFDPTRENALAHEHVIEAVMKSNTIIPMSFGTVFRTDDDIRQVLRSIYPSLQDVLEQMADKLEFGLKVTWDRESVVEQLKRENDEIHRFHIELTRKHLQSTYFARMQLGRMIEKALAERAAEYVRQIYEALRGVCVASRDNKPIGDKMIMNAAFLIRRSREPDFDAMVNKIATKFADRLNFKYTGPWPPYNFVNIRLKLEKGTPS